MLCPRCAAPLVTIASAEPWCSVCEWNLLRFDPVRHRDGLGWAWLDRRLYAMTFAASETRYRSLRSRPLHRRASPARMATIVATAALLGGVLALAITGGWLVARHISSPVTVMGALLIAIAVGLGPRFGRLAPMTVDAGRVSSDEAPRLFALIGRVAAAIGAPLPHVVLVGETFDVSVTTVGLRRRRVLRLGAPLWATLGRQERVALLGHELGKFIAGDLRQGLFTRSAEDAIAKVVYLFTPVRGLTEATKSPATGVFMSALADVLVTTIGGTLARLVYLLSLTLARVAGVDSQRAAYFADELAAAAAGTPGAVGLLDHLLLHDSIDTVVCREARARKDAAAWRVAAVTAYENTTPTLPLHRQLSRRRDTSPLFPAPPLGLRARMLMHRPARPARVALLESEAESIDAELASYYERARTHLAHKV